MHLSAQCQYAVRAMFSLARHHGEPRPLRAVDLSQETGIPEKYVPQVLGSLKRAGMAVSVRGASGGYRLAREPAAVTVGEVVRAIHGPYVSVDCMRGDGCELDPEGCALRGTWQRVQDAVSDVLDATTFADLVVRSAGTRNYVI